VGGGRLDRLHIRAHLRWVSRWIRRLLVVAGARCPLTKPVVAAVEPQAANSAGPNCSRGVQPGDIYVYASAADGDNGINRVLQVKVPTLTVRNKVPVQCYRDRFEGRALGLGVNLLLGERRVSLAAGKSLVFAVEKAYFGGRDGFIF
jgi:hypothetical protein